MKAAIIAGGLGRRMYEMTDNSPKPMLPIGPKPLLEHQIELFSRWGCEEITLCTGYLSQSIEDYFSNTIAPANIRFSVEEKPLGTAGALKLAFPDLNEPLLVLYGDIMVDMDVRAFIDFHIAHSPVASLVVHPNDHIDDSDLIELDQDNRIVNMYRKPHDPEKYYPNLDNCGFYIFEPEVIDLIPEGVKSDIAHDVFPRILQGDLSMYGYRSAEYLKDIGTPTRHEEVKQDWQSGKIQRLNRTQPRPAIFLDRDGVLINDVHHLHRLDQVHMISNVVEAIQTVNKSDFLAIVVTNQSVLARGLCTEEELRMIHYKIETLLGHERAWLDGIYYCPHHPEHAYRGNSTCKCRKPQTGMIERAQHEFNIDLKKSFMIGDSTCDIETARRVGVTPILLKTGYAGLYGQYDIGNVSVYEDLLDAVNVIANGEQL